LSTRQINDCFRKEKEKKKKKKKKEKTPLVVMTQPA
jgi:hypothetical protein